MYSVVRVLSVVRGVRNGDIATAGELLGGEVALAQILHLVQGHWRVTMIVRKIKYKNQAKQQVLENNVKEKFKVPQKRRRKKKPFQMTALN